MSGGLSEKRKSFEDNGTSHCKGFPIHETSAGEHIVLLIRDLAVHQT